MKYTILCTSCNAIRSFDSENNEQLPDTNVLSQAAHSEDCTIQQSGSGGITIDMSNSSNTLYSIS